MTTDQNVLLLILLALLILLVWGRWRYDIVALGALFTASIFGLIPQTEMFAGFGNPATVTVIMVLIVIITPHILLVLLYLSLFILSLINN